MACCKAARVAIIVDNARSRDLYVKLMSAWHSAAANPFMRVYSVPAWRATLMCLRGLSDHGCFWYFPSVGKSSADSSNIECGPQKRTNHGATNSGTMKHRPRLKKCIHGTKALCSYLQEVFRCTVSDSSQHCAPYSDHAPKRKCHLQAQLALRCNEVRRSSTPHVCPSPGLGPTRLAVLIRHASADPFQSIAKAPRLPTSVQYLLQAAWSWLYLISCSLVISSTGSAPYRFKW